jgi:anaerobic magnesium-protoporphyrin IX monomethyl ester cyclase
MRILMIQPNYHCGGAEIAGNWPPGWVAYIGGALKHAGMTNIRFVDAMTYDLSDEKLREIIRINKPDVVLATAITPQIYKAQTTLQIAKEVLPDVVTVLGGIHPTFMYTQVFSEAPWIDYIVRGEGEEIAVALLQSIEAGTHRKDRKRIWGIAYIDDDGQVVATPARPVIEDLDTLTPDWSLLDWDKYIYTRSIAGSPCPTSHAAAPSPAASAPSGSSGASTAIAIPRSSSTRSRPWCATTTSAS